MEELYINSAASGQEDDFGGEQQNQESFVSLSEMFGKIKDQTAAENQQNAPETGANPAPRNGGANRSQPQTDPNKISNQTDFNRVLSGRLAEERERVAKRYESASAYQIGQRILQEYMTRDGLNEEQAARKFAEERAEQQAELYAKNQKEYIKAQLMGQFNPPQPDASRRPAPVAEDTDDTTDPQSAGQVLSQMAQYGELPEGFSQKSIDRTFVEDVQRFGVRRAVALWERENAGAPRTPAQNGAVPSRASIASELERRQRLSTPMRVNGADAQPQPLDFSNMTKEQFAEFDKQIERGFRNGMKYTP